MHISTSLSEATNRLFLGSSRNCQGQRAARPMAAQPSASVAPADAAPQPSASVAPADAAPRPATAPIPIDRISKGAL
eukprot:4271241-Prymnesium_polylepis.1